VPAIFARLTASGWSAMSFSVGRSGPAGPGVAPAFRKTRTGNTGFANRCVVAGGPEKMIQDNPTPPGKRRQRPEAVLKIRVTGLPCVWARMCISRETRRPPGPDLRSLQVRQGRWRSGEGVNWRGFRLFGARRIFYDRKRGYYRKTNRAGGIEGGMTNGADLIVRVRLSPLPRCQGAPVVIWHENRAGEFRALG